MEIITRIPEPPPRCPGCKRRARPPLWLGRGEYDAPWPHPSTCRTRWDPVYKRRAEDRYLSWMQREGYFVPDYNAIPPRHRYLVGVL
jgi:hypothetical protein